MDILPSSHFLQLLTNGDSNSREFVDPPGKLFSRDLVLHVMPILHINYTIFIVSLGLPPVTIKKKVFLFDHILEI